jgi:MSHA biogenesis protein MshN
MSLINKMLQELDKRHAVDEAGKPAAPGDAKSLAQHLRPVAAKRDFGEAFWRIMAGLMVVVVCWVGWLLWQITPKPVVTELAYQARGQVHAAPSPVAVPALPVAVASAPAADSSVAAAPTSSEKGAESAAPVAAAPPAPAVASSTAAVPAEPAKVDMLRLATEITTPIPARRAKSAPVKAETKSGKVSPTDAKTLAAVAPSAAHVPAPAASPREESHVAAPKTAVTDGRIDKRSNANPRERADAEFRRATAFINQGRVAEAMEALGASLSIDPGHEAARQTAVGLQLENRHVDDAQRLLQDGLALNPANTGFAMLLARILVERGDLNGALATLQKHGGAAASNADYLAFSAAILQRLGRHKEAVDIYQAALRLQPGSGVWWMGLAISLQTQKQTAEAVEAFKRARSAGTLSPDLLAFVEQRIKQLQ